MKKREKIDSSDLRKVVVKWEVKRYAELYEQYSRTTCRGFAEYIRRVVDREPVVVRHRNESLDDLLQAMVEIRNSLEGIDSSYRRAVSHLRSCVPTDDVSPALAVLLTEECTVRKEVAEIKSLLIKIYEQCSSI